MIVATRRARCACSIGTIRSDRWKARFGGAIGERDADAKSKALSATPRRSKRYFDGDIAVIDKMPVAFAGTPFQLKVWNALRTIPGGTTT